MHEMEACAPRSWKIIEQITWSDWHDAVWRFFLGLEKFSFSLFWSTGTHIHMRKFSISLISSSTEANCNINYINIQNILVTFFSNAFQANERRKKNRHYEYVLQIIQLNCEYVREANTSSKTSFAYWMRIIIEFDNCHGVARCIFHDRFQPFVNSIPVNVCYRRRQRRFGCVVAVSRQLPDSCHFYAEQCKVICFVLPTLRVWVSIFLSFSLFLVCFVAAAANTTLATQQSKVVSAVW